MESSSKSIDSLAIQDFLVNQLFLLFFQNINFLLGSYFFIGSFQIESKFARSIVFFKMIQLILVYYSLYEWRRNTYTNRNSIFY